MQTKTRKVLMGLVGAYLAYTGVKLISDVMAGNPKNKAAFIVCGVIFVLFGVFTIIYNIIQFIKESKAENEASEEESSEEEPKEAESDDMDGVVLDAEDAMDEEDS